VTTRLWCLGDFFGALCSACDTVGTASTRGEAGTQPRRADCPLKYASPGLLGGIEIDRFGKSFVDANRESVVNRLPRRDISQKNFENFIRLFCNVTDCMAL